MRHIHILPSRPRRCTPLLLIPLLTFAACSESEHESPDDAQQVADLPAGPLSDPLARGTPPSQPATSTSPAPYAGTLLVSEGIQLTIPPEWIQEEPNSSMRVAQYRIPATSNNGKPAEMAVFRIRGGGVEDNFARWIRQFTEVSVDPERNERTADNLSINWITLRGTYTVAPMAGGTGEPLPDTLFHGIIINGAEVPMQIRISGPAATLDQRDDEIRSLIDSIEPSSR